MNHPAVGWALALGALAAGYAGYGVPGLALALSCIVFWLLLQFSRALRVLRRAGEQPVGQVRSAVMLHAKLQQGLRLLEIVPLAGSLGQRVGEVPTRPDQPETFAWTDASGACVQVTLKNGRCSGWTLQRPPEPPGPET